jgi:hypothetical protein
LEDWHALIDIVDQGMHTAQQSRHKRIVNGHASIAAA